MFEPNRLVVYCQLRLCIPTALDIAFNHMREIQCKSPCPITGTVSAGYSARQVSSAIGRCSIFPAELVAYKDIASASEKRGRRRRPGRQIPAANAAQTDTAHTPPPSQSGSGMRSPTAETLHQLQHDRPLGDPMPVSTLHRRSCFIH